MPLDLRWKNPAGSDPYQLYRWGQDTISELRKGSDSKWPGFLQSGTGAIARTWLSKERDIFSAKDFGCQGDGVTDDTTNLQNACTAAFNAGAALYLPGGTYVISASIFLGAGVRIFGDGPFQTILFAKANAAITAMFNFNNNNYVQVENMQLNGNFANAGSNGIGVFTGTSYKFRMYRLFIQNMGTDGIQMQGGQAVPTFGPECTLEDIVIDTVQHHGINFQGPTDGHFHNIIVVDAGQATNNTYDGLIVQAPGGGNIANGRFFNFHAYHRSTSTNRMKAAAEVLGAGCQFVASHFEGAWTAPLINNASDNHYVGCRIFAAWNGKTAIIQQPCTLSGCILEAPGPSRPAAVGITLGLSNSDNPTNCYINCVGGSQTAGLIDFTFTKGNNIIDITAFNASGTAMIGSPALNDMCRINVTGTPYQFNGGGPWWTSPAIESAATSYTVTQNDSVLNFGAAGAVTVTLPAVASSNGRMLWVVTKTAQSVSSASANVEPLAGGAATTVILPATAGKWALLQCDGTSWQIIASN